MFLVNALECSENYVGLALVVSYGVDRLYRFRLQCCINFMSLLHNRINVNFELVIYGLFGFRRYLKD